MADRCRLHQETLSVTRDGVDSDEESLVSIEGQLLYWDTAEPVDERNEQAFRAVLGRCLGVALPSSRAPGARDGWGRLGRRRDPRVLALGAYVVFLNEQGRLTDEAALMAIFDGLEAPDDRPSPDDVSSAAHVTGWSDSSAFDTGHVLLDLTRYLGDYTWTASPMLPMQERGPRRVWSGNGIANDISRGAMLPEADAFVDDLAWRVARMGWPSNPAPNPYVAAVSGSGAEENTADLVDLPPLLEEVD